MHFLSLHQSNLLSEIGLKVIKQKVVLAKTIAEIHDVELKEVNRLINNNIDEFEEGIDVLDLKGNEDFEVISNDHGLMSQNEINRSSNIYLCSGNKYILFAFDICILLNPKFFNCSG